MSAKDLKPYRQILREHTGDIEKQPDDLMESRKLDGVDPEKLIREIKNYLIYGRMSDRERRGYMALLTRLGKSK